MMSHIQRLELISQKIRNEKVMSVDDLQIEVSKALDDILQILKSYKRQIDEIDIAANRRRFFWTKVLRMAVPHDGVDVGVEDVAEGGEARRTEGCASWEGTLMTDERFKEIDEFRLEHDHLPDGAFFQLGIERGISFDEWVAWCKKDIKRDLDERFPETEPHGPEKQGWH